MERIHSMSMEGQENLRIVEHLDMQKLPESVQQMLSLASTSEEQDIILMATLAAASACVPNMYFRYGPSDFSRLLTVVIRGTNGFDIHKINKIKKSDKSDTAT